jgi:hypothetical protein
MDVEITKPKMIYSDDNKEDPKSLEQKEDVAPVVKTINLNDLAKLLAKAIKKED